jgi:hypothetical protein
MNRIGRVLAALALVMPIIFSVAMLLTAGGCSGSSGTAGQAGGTGEVDKAAQEKMKDYIKNRPVLKPGTQNKK